MEVISARLKCCPRCKQEKPFTEFAVDRKKRDGRFYICKICKCADDKRRREDPVLGLMMREANKSWHRKNPERSRALRRRGGLKRKFGMTEADYIALVEAQSGLCAICDEPPRPEDPGGVLVVDHDHETSEIRGLLCHRCNRGLGQFRDDRRVIARALDYLHPERPRWKRDESRQIARWREVDQLSLSDDTEG